MLFRVVVGGHRQDKVDYRAGDIVESDRDLRTIFPNKFELVVPETAKEVVVPATVQAAFEEEAADQQVEELKKTVEEEVLGEDVTDDFPLAVDQDIKVWAVKQGKSTKYIPTSAEPPYDRLSEVPLTKKGLLSLLQGDDEDE